jgi:hypothetical protein
LPETKLETRLVRFKQYTTELNAYHQAWPQLIPCAGAVEDLCFRGRSLFDLKEYTTTKYTRLPAAPFLVPAVKEALCQSLRYGTLAYGVPGEADAYCAQEVKNHGGLILTGDSDLLVYNLGSGAVIFFRDIELVRDEGVSSLRCMQYSPASISTKLGIPSSHGLPSLAFEMRMDPHATFNQLKQRAAQLQAISSQQAMYQDFMKEYRSLDDLPPDRRILLAVESFRSETRKLDPRVSEYIYSFLSVGRDPDLSAQRSVGGVDNRRIFLPFLLDCPARTSAWEMSVSVRLLAYGFMHVLRAADEDGDSILEYRRLQSGTQAKRWQLPTLDQIADTSQDLVNVWHQLRMVYDVTGKSYDTLWSAFAIYQDLTYSFNNSKEPLSRVVLHPAVRARADSRRVTWDKVHFFAQMQGSYYSLRILKQVLEVLRWWALPKCADDPIFRIINDLYQCIKSLPPLSDADSFSQTACDFGNIGYAGLWDTVNTYFEQSLSSENTQEGKQTAHESSARRNAKKKRRNKGRRSNGFEALSTH